MATRRRNDEFRTKQNRALQGNRSENIEKTREPQRRQLMHTNNQILIISKNYIGGHLPKGKRVTLSMYEKWTGTVFHSNLSNGSYLTGLKQTKWDSLWNLRPLEERLISPCIPFLQILELPGGGQLIIYSWQCCQCTSRYKFNCKHFIKMNHKLSPSNKGWVTSIIINFRMLDKEKCWEQHVSWRTELAWHFRDIKR